MRFISALLLLLAWQISHACLNDRDTLRRERMGLPSAQQAILGWFPRMPKDYYRLRIERIKKQKSLYADEYDDLAVAHDKLGEYDQAIAAMATKWKILEDPKHAWRIRTVLDAAFQYADDLPPEKYQRYTYYANLGTFLIHRWISQGMPLAKIADAEKGQSLVAMAVKINPDAHSGREWVQMDLAAALIRKVKHPSQPLDIQWSRPKPDDQIKGLVGLITMGNAWESIDVYSLLAKVLSETQRPTMAYLAKLRIEELKKAGKKSVLGLEDLPLNPVVRNPNRFEQYFVSTRKRAEVIHAQNEAIAQQIRSGGQEADEAYEFGEMLSMKTMPEYQLTFWEEHQSTLLLIPPVFILAALLVSPWIAYRWWKRRRILKMGPAQRMGPVDE